jgi:MYXO-CTERM domain-containing protein
MRARTACVTVTTALTAAALYLAAEGPARACQPPLPGLFGSIPDDGAEHPANAAVLLEGYYIALDAVTVTVDGAPAVLVEQPPLPWINGVFVRIEPQPQPGQEVILEGDFCPEPDQCEPRSITFTATAPDLTPPAPIAAFSVDIYAYPTADPGVGSCMSPSDFTRYFRVSAPLPAPEESYNIHRLSVVGEGPVLPSRLAVTADMTIAVSGVEAELMGAPLAEAACFRVDTVDLAGNVGPASPPICLPCRMRVDTRAPFVPVEPTWTDDDLFPGGPCATVDETTGGSTTADATTADATTADASTDTTDATSTSDLTTTTTTTASSTDTSGGADDPSGCACRGGPPSSTSPTAVGLLLLVLGLGRRRGARA